MMGELIVDLFAGGGGASEGVRLALRRSPDIAINHDDDALSMHEANHPATRHLRANLMKVNPMTCVGDAPIGLLWASPDCTHHSKAKGGKPVKKYRRDLAWIVVKWARAKRPRVIMLENVEEFRQWGPLTRKLGGDGKPLLDIHGSPMLVPCKARKGQEFDRFVEAFRRMGYRVEWRERRCSKIGVPTTRKRLAVIMRRDGRPIVWPADTHDDPKSPAVLRHGLKPWRTAAECIDWSLAPCPSIFLTREEARALGVKRPLAAATMARIGKGVWRYVINAAEPFIVPVKTWGGGGNEPRSVDEPMRTTTASKRGEHALVTPFVTKFNHHSTGHRVDEPLHTVTTAYSETHPGGASTFGLVTPFIAGLAHGDSGGRRAYPADEPLTMVHAQGTNHALVAGYLVPRHGERPGQDPRALPIDVPMPTVVGTANGGSLVAAMMAKFQENGAGSSPDEPLHTVMAGAPRHAVVAADLQGPVISFSQMMAEINEVAKGAPGPSSRVAAFLAQHNYQEPGHDARDPLSTIVTKGCTQGLVVSHLMNMKGSERASHGIDAPVPTICASTTHAAEVRAFLIKYYGSGVAAGLDEPLDTVTCLPRFGLVTVAGALYQIVDIGMRMLTPRELYRAHAFRDDYIIDRGHDGRRFSKTVQVRMVGNSVPPPFASTLIAANVPELAAPPAELLDAAAGLAWREGMA